MRTKCKTSLLLLAAALLPVAGCAKKADDDDSETEETGGPPSGSGGNSPTQSSLGAEAASSLEKVAANMLPGSLALKGASLSLLENEDPCAEADGFFDCQPNLLRLYMDLAQEAVFNTSDMVAKMSGALFQHVTPPSDGVETCNKVTPEDDPSLQSVEYCVTSKAKYSLRFDTDLGPFLAFEVDGSAYHVWVDGANDPDREGDGGPTKIEIIVDYASETDFDVDLRLFGATCRADDVRAPSSIAIKVDRQPTVWQGKAMLYSPRWLFKQEDNVTCATKPTTAMGMTIYTDFVGDDTNSTASLYMMPLTVTDTADITEWPASAFCPKFPGYCFNGYGFGDPNPVAGYANPFCVTGAEVTWSGACESANSLISTPTYSDVGQFFAPSALPELSLTFPEVAP